MRKLILVGLLACVCSSLALADGDHSKVLPDPLQVGMAQKVQRPGAERPRVSGVPFKEQAKVILENGGPFGSCPVVPAAPRHVVEPERDEEYPVCRPDSRLWCREEARRVCGWDGETLDGRVEVHNFNRIAVCVIFCNNDPIPHNHVCQHPQGQGGTQYPGYPYPLPPVEPPLL